MCFPYSGPLQEYFIISVLPGLNKGWPLFWLVPSYLDYFLYLSRADSTVLF